jgi:hypothetical protein
MRQSQGITPAVVTACLLCGFALTTAMPAAASQPDGSTPIAYPQPLLSADKTTVRAGETLNLRLDHGRETVNWISSAAFVRNGHPDGADEGIAAVTQDRDGFANASATIATVPEGVYTIQTRIGGGSGPRITVTVAR